jgi:hypothetical protein
MIVRVFQRIVTLALTAAMILGAAERLYLKDGDYQLVSEYQVLKDRVRYYSTERGEWEEIPLEFVDLDRTKKEAAEMQAELDRDAKERAEEDAAIRSARKQLMQVPAKAGVYYIRGETLEPFKLAESKIVTDKKRSILKALSPIPIISGKATLELDGETSSQKVSEPRPEFFFRLSDYEGFAIVKLTPTKKGARLVESLSIVTLQGERFVDETRQVVPSFKKQEDDLLYRIWPEKPLEPGEYALIQYTDGKLNPQIWDFSVTK